jgi:hypothetical protein
MGKFFLFIIYLLQVFHYSDANLTQKIGIKKGAVSATTIYLKMWKNLWNWFMGRSWNLIRTG